MSSQSDVEAELAALKAGTTGGAAPQLEQADSTPPAVEAAEETGKEQGPA
jgi:hypothetical protein